MTETFTFETPLVEILVRGTAVYLTIALIFRLMPKRQTGNLSPNDLIALIIIGGLAAGAIAGKARTVPDILLMIAVVMGWDYVFNVVEYYFPRLRGVAQDSPTLLIYNGRLLKDNLKKEKLTEQELDASLRQQGCANISQVKQAILEVDGKISVIKMNL